MDAYLRTFVYCFATFGLAFILGYSKIFEPFRAALWKAGPAGRFLVTLVECPGCLGWWVGVAAVIFHFDPFGWPLTAWHVIYAGLFTSGTTMFLAMRSGLVPPAHAP